MKSPLTLQTLLKQIHVKTFVTLVDDCYLGGLDRVRQLQIHQRIFTVSSPNTGHVTLCSNRFKIQYAYNVLKNLCGPSRLYKTSLFNF